MERILKAGERDENFMASGIMIAICCSGYACLV
jgi:hypothetical protein